MKLKKIDELKEPPVVGEYYLVPCIVSKNIYFDNEGRLYDPNAINREIEVRYTPVYNHPHNDKENGQIEEHYHTDFRFENHEHLLFAGGFLRKYIGNRNTKHIQYIKLAFKIDIEPYPTPISLIRKSKLKHHCIYKGKCPHRGYDLSQAVPNEDGEIVCPLHSLRFDAITKQLITG